MKGIKEDKDELVFRPLDLNSLRLVCFSDAGFVSHGDDYRSQIGFIIAMVDKNENANVVAFASRKCRRVTRSVLARELLALVEGYDADFGIESQLHEILDKQVPISRAVGSRTMYNVVTRLGHVTEQRLHVDVADLRHEHLACRLNIIWIPSEENCADPLTKKKGSTKALCQLLNEKLSLRPNAWVGRTHEKCLPDDNIMPLH